MSEWITHRRPTEDDATAYCYEGLVWAYTKSGPRLYTWDQVEDHPWQPINVPDPYAKTKRWNVVNSQKIGFIVYDGTKVMKVVAINLPTREAAERIAAIYEEMMP